MTRLCLAALLLLAIAFPALAQTPGRIGTVKEVKGAAFILAAGSARRPATVGGFLYQGETIETGDDGAVGVTFIDNTTLAVGPRSRITLTRVVFDPDKGNLGFAASILRGTFLFVSGEIAKLRPEAVAITTPVSTIGIRGTKFLVKIDD